MNSSELWLGGDLDTAAYWSPEDIRALEAELDEFKATGMLLRPIPNRLYGARINEDGCVI